jgi:radical SAM superfamily enzyme YgiQ (UPF0313 family)
MTLESVNDEILARLDKGHTTAQAVLAIELLREHGIETRPSFMPFTPWATPADARTSRWHRQHLHRFIRDTNAIEALNRQLRKAVKTKGYFPSEDAARKLIYLAIQNAVPQWTRTRAWTKALLAFKIHFGDRLPN